MIRNNKVILALVISFLIGVTTANAFRISRPPTLTLPLNNNQISQLNDYLESIWNLQNGEFNFDVVTSTKSRAKNGDLWFLLSGGTVYIQYKANDVTNTIVPDS